jgi:hypothetical protein
MSLASLQAWEQYLSPFGAAQVQEEWAHFSVAMKDSSVIPLYDAPGSPAGTRSAFRSGEHLL